MSRKLTVVAAAAMLAMVGATFSVTPTVAHDDDASEAAYIFSPDHQAIVSVGEKASVQTRGTASSSADDGSVLPTSFYTSGAADYAVATSTPGLNEALVVGDVSLADTDIPFADSSWTATQNARGTTLITLKWEAAPGVNQYEVQFNGTTRTTPYNFITLQNLTPGDSTEVVVTGTGTFPPGEEVPEWADANDAYGYSWVFEVKTPSDFSTAGINSWLAEREFEATAAQYTRSTARFRAFIPTKYIDGGTGCTYKPPTYHFNGNNRGYSLAESASYKTNSQGSYAWESKTFTPSVNTGTTIVYNASNVEVTRQKATTAKMSSRLLSQDNKYVGMRLIQDASDPFCSIGAVGANATVTLTRTGTYTVSGIHKQFPHIELNIQRHYNGKKNMTAAYRRDGASPTCLFKPACATASINVRGSY